MKFIATTILILCHLSHIYAQQSTRTDSLSSSNKPIVIIDSFTTSIEYLIMDPNNIESMSVYKDSATLERYGSKAKNGVITIQPKPKVKLVRFNQLLGKYGSPDSLRNFRIRINDVIVTRPDLLLFDESYVISIGILEADDWTDLSNVKREKFLTITTKK